MEGKNLKPLEGMVSDLMEGDLVLFQIESRSAINWMSYISLFVKDLNSHRIRLGPISHISKLPLSEDYFIDTHEAVMYGESHPPTVSSLETVHVMGYQILLRSKDLLRS